MSVLGNFWVFHNELNEANSESILKIIKEQLEDNKLEKD